MFTEWNRLPVREEEHMERAVYSPSPGFGTFLFGVGMLGLGMLLGSEIIAATKAGKAYLRRKIEKI